MKYRLKFFVPFVLLMSLCRCGGSLQSELESLFSGSESQLREDILVLNRELLKLDFSLPEADKTYEEKHTEYENKLTELRMLMLSQEFPAVEHREIKLLDGKSGEVFVSSRIPFEVKTSSSNGFSSTREGGPSLVKRYRVFAWSKDLMAPETTMLREEKPERMKMMSLLSDPNQKWLKVPGPDATRGPALSLAQNIGSSEWEFLDELPEDGEEDVYENQARLQRAKDRFKAFSSTLVKPFRRSSFRAAGNFGFEEEDGF